MESILASQALLFLPAIMFSIRLVTANPPTTLIIARTSARNARRPETSVSPPLIGDVGSKQCADDADAGDGVCTAHERCVEGGWDLRDQLESEENGEHEEGQITDQRCFSDHSTTPRKPCLLRMNGAVFANQDTSHAVHVEIRALGCTNQDVVFIGNVDNAFLFVDQGCEKGGKVV